MDISLLTKKSSRPADITEVYQTFREELTLILLKLLQKIEQKGTHPNSFYEDSITLIPKPDKDTIRKLQTNIPDDY